MLALAFITVVIGVPLVPALVLASVRDGAPWRRRYWSA